MRSDPDDRAMLARMLSIGAEQLEEGRAGFMAGWARQGARQVVEDGETIRLQAERIHELESSPGSRSAPASDDLDRCADCGDPIEQPRTGRRRKFCGRGRCARTPKTVSSRS